MVNSSAASACTALRFAFMLWIIIRCKGSQGYFTGGKHVRADQQHSGRSVGRHRSARSKRGRRRGVPRSTPDATHSYHVVVADGTCSTGPGAGQEATVTLALSAPDFLRLISGKLNGMQAFMSGKLKLKGDMMLAQSMQTWFDAS